MTSILTFASLKTLKKVHSHSVLLSYFLCVFLLCSEFFVFRGKDLFVAVSGCLIFCFFGKGLLVVSGCLSNSHGLCGFR